jgi:hypothetical protein
LTYHYLNSAADLHLKLFIHRASPTATASKSKDRHLNAHHCEEPFIFISKEDKEVALVADAFGFSDRFPFDQLLVRSEKESHQSIYYCSASVKRFLLAKNAHRLKVVNTGVKLMSRTHDPEALAICTHRFNSEGVDLVAPFLSRRCVNLDFPTLRTLLLEERPHIRCLPTPSLVQSFTEIPHGGIVCRYEDKENPLVLWFSMWRAKVSVGLLVNKKERLSLLHRFDIPVPVPTPSATLEDKETISVASETTTETSISPAVA